MLQIWRKLLIECLRTLNDRKLGVEEWLVKIVQSMYGNARSRIRANETFSDDFMVH